MAFATSGDRSPSVDKVHFAPATGYTTLVEAEDADLLSCNSQGAGDGGQVIGGCFLGFTNSYTVDMPKAGAAVFTLRGSTINPNTIVRIRDEGNLLLGAVHLDGNNYNVYSTSSVTLKPLIAGRQTLRLEVFNFASNHNWFTLDQ